MYAFPIDEAVIIDVPTTSVPMYAFPMVDNEMLTLSNDAEPELIAVFTRLSAVANDKYTFRALTSPSKAEPEVKASLIRFAADAVDVYEEETNAFEITAEFVVKFVLEISVIVEVFTLAESMEADEIYALPVVEY